MLSLTQRIAVHVEQKFAGEGSGHDWHHIARVWRMAKRLAIEEGADLEIVEIAALLHDIADHKFHGGDETVGPQEARRLLESHQAPPNVIDAVAEIVATVSYKGAGVPTPMRTIEGACVQDADRLDAIGAIGIARCFAYGGHAGRPLHEPQAQAQLHTRAADYKASKSASLAHFYEKLFLLKDRLNTTAARQIAEARHHYMEAFVDQFLAEWNGER